MKEELSIFFKISIFKKILNSSSISCKINQFFLICSFLNLELNQSNVCLHSTVNHNTFFSFKNIQFSEPSTSYPSPEIWANFFKKFLWKIPYFILLKIFFGKFLILFFLKIFFGKFLILFFFKFSLENSLFYFYPLELQ